MRRFLFNLAALLSVVAFVGLGVLWVATYWRSDVFIWGEWHSPSGPPYNHESRCVDLATFRGDLAIDSDRPLLPTFFQASHLTHVVGAPITTTLPHFAGFHFDWNAAGIYIILPIWFVMIFTLPLPILWLRRWRKRRSDGRGFAIHIERDRFDVER